MVLKAYRWLHDRNKAIAIPKRTDRPMARAFLSWSDIRQSLKLYASGLCPGAYRMRLALAEKNLPSSLNISTKPFHSIP
jgi:hypothetical protein